MFKPSLEFYIPFRQTGHSGGKMLAPGTTLQLLATMQHKHAPRDMHWQHDSCRRYVRLLTT